VRSFKRIDVLGCPFDAISFGETADYIRQAIVEHRRVQIVTGNIDFVMKARRDPVFARELRDADLVVADGVPILWAADLLGTPLKGRVNGTDLVWKCAELSHELGFGIAFVGGDYANSVAAAENLKSRYPRATILPLLTPFPLNAEASSVLIEQVRTANAKIVLAALGAPKQERWLSAHLEETGASVGMGIGSAFDIISGKLRRAPRWMQRGGLEWFHRMLLEPRRLGRRYLLENSPFVPALALEIARRKLAKQRVASPGR